MAVKFPDGFINYELDPIESTHVIQPINTMFGTVVHSAVGPYQMQTATMRLHMTYEMYADLYEGYNQPEEDEYYDKLHCYSTELYDINKEFRLTTVNHTNANRQEFIVELTFDFFVTQEFFEHTMDMQGFLDKKVLKLLDDMYKLRIMTDLRGNGNYDNVDDIQQ